VTGLATGAIREQQVLWFRSPLKKRTYFSLKDPPKLSMELMGQARKSAAETPFVTVVAKSAAVIGYNASIITSPRSSLGRGCIGTLP
jgi:hypothetical protein